MPLPYFLYLRNTATEMQQPTQLEWAHRLAQKQGWQIVREFSDTPNAKRTGFENLIRALAKYPDGVGLICFRFDRLVRNIVEVGLLKQALMQGKIRHLIASDREFREGEQQILLDVEFDAATPHSPNCSRQVRRGFFSFG